MFLNVKRNRTVSNQCELSSEEVLFKNTYASIKKYSLENPSSKFISPIDIDDKDKKLVSILKKYPNFAFALTEDNVPFILRCVECQMDRSVSAFLVNNQNKVDVLVSDAEGNTIAHYAHKYQRETLVKISCLIPDLMDCINENGVSLRFLLSRDNKKTNISNHVLGEAKEQSREA